MTDKERRAKADARKRAKNLYKPSIWVDKSWQGTPEFEAEKERLGKPLRRE